LDRKKVGNKLSLLSRFGQTWEIKINFLKQKNFMDKKLQTVKTYNDSAKQLAKKFDDLGARTEDIREAFNLVKKVNPHVLEIGCGNGRDAKEIIKHTDSYLGIDISTELIKLARQNVPGVKFEVADIETYNFPSSLDIIFAFASLIHVPKPSLKKILQQSFLSLNNGGIVRLSLKYADKYFETTKDDEFGTRTYFLYSKSDIEEITGEFVIYKNEAVNFGPQSWLEIILIKKQTTFLGRKT